MSNEHYNVFYTRPLTDAEIQAREVTIKMDPYRVCDVYGVGGGAREQIIKKGLRWISKGDTEKQVLTEIISAASRRIEMLDEDQVIIPPPIYTRDMAIRWCIDNSVIFSGNIPNPTLPDGWTWYDDNTKLGEGKFMRGPVDQDDVTADDVYGIQIPAQPAPMPLIREQAIEWCRNNHISFIDNREDTPIGWQWVNLKHQPLHLACAYPRQASVTAVDVYGEDVPFFTREQVIKWCIDNAVDFGSCSGLGDNNITPPYGWGWWKVRKANTHFELYCIDKGITQVVKVNDVKP